jgi:hypothetical protein
MLKKIIVITAIFLLCLGTVDIAFGNYVNSFAEEPEREVAEGELIVHRDVYEPPSPELITSIGGYSQPTKWKSYEDYDCDGLSNKEELELGTNPYLKDTDDDYIIDSVEVYWRTNPNSWDTDGDRLGDYVEMGYVGIGTSPFTDDSDSDGLPDPWEDNDGDTILNIEEQDPKFKYGMLATNPNEVDSDGDSISDDKEAQVNGPGPISKNSEEIAGYTQVNIIGDRSNSELNMQPSASPSKLATFLKFWGWTDDDLQYWYDGLMAANAAGVITSGSGNTVWYHHHPDIWPIPWALYAWNVTRGAPFRWNNYDTNPSVNDTDGDLMDDDWDPRPLIADDRLDAYVAINKITYKGQSYDALGPTNGNFTGPDGFDANFSNLGLKKGDQVTLTLWLGLENSSVSSDHVKNGWWRPINVSISFGTFFLGADNRSHGTGPNDIRGDDLWPDVKSAGLPRIPDKPWITVGSGNYKGSRTFTNSTNMSSTMHFYEQIVTIYMPADLPAGIIGFILNANPNTGENFYYETYEWPYVGY